MSEGLFKPEKLLALSILPLDMEQCPRRGKDHHSCFIDRRQDLVVCCCSASERVVEPVPGGGFLFSRFCRP